MKSESEQERGAGAMRGAVRKLIPPRRWRVPVILIMGAGFGLSFVTLHISNATSYLSDDPRACVNCHVMKPQFATWERGSHGKVATCNDCHVPHDTLANKYYFKAKDGTRHAFMFTFHMEPQVIRVHEPGQKVIQQNCIRCHEQMVNFGTMNAAVSFEEVEHGQGKFCWDCHVDTPHGRVNSLSAAPHARTPSLESPVPEWLLEKLSSEEKP